MFEVVCVCTCVGECKHGHVCAYIRDISFTNFECEDLVCVGGFACVRALTHARASARARALVCVWLCVCVLDNASTDLKCEDERKGVCVCVCVSVFVCL